MSYIVTACKHDSNGTDDVGSGYRKCFSIIARGCVPSVCKAAEMLVSTIKYKREIVFLKTLPSIA
jgi:hypothetical protein